MAERESVKPIVNCRFTISGGDKFSAGETYFSEISGIDATYDVVEYRAGDSANLTVQKFPGLIKYGDVTIKRCVTNSTAFYDWINSTNNTGTKLEKVETVTISLVDVDTTTPLATWELHNVWPSKYEGPSMNAQSAEIAFESITLCHEGVTRTAV